MAPRDLDSNLIFFPADDGIPPHTGPTHDVLWIIVRGNGFLWREFPPEESESTPNDSSCISISSGDIIYLPASSVRGITAGHEGIGYLTVHQHRYGGLSIQSHPGNK